jgi:hyperosmotically inducible protein
VLPHPSQGRKQEHIHTVCFLVGDALETFNSLQASPLMEEVTMRVTVLGSVLAAGALLVTTPYSGLAQQSDATTNQRAGSAERMNPPSSENRIQREVHHELVMLPYYGVFDNLAYRIDGGTVTLFGQVTRPTLKSDAENVVKNVEGVNRVVNNIEVLPVSSMDDRIRLAEYRAIYSQPTLNKYALQAVPPIHIIVKNGHVTLVGVVANESDKNVAGIQAKSVPGVFSVENNLQVESKR